MLSAQKNKINLVIIPANIDSILSNSIYLYGGTHGLPYTFNLSLRMNLFNHITTGAVKPLRLLYFNYSFFPVPMEEPPLNLRFALPLSTAHLKL